MQSIGIYKVDRLIAKGGMGEVFLAHDPVCERPVALKKMRAEFLKYETMKRRFLKEAKIASQLAHPSIVPIYFIHQEEDEAYYTMPYIEGESLKEILRHTIAKIRAGETPHPIGTSIPSLIRIFLSVCQAVSFAHAKNILHRDLKPGNIMVGKFGQTMILDWGLAKHFSDEEDEEEIEIPESIPHELTRPGKAVGTLTYMAPERAYNHPASIQSDIYSLGVILYQILTLKTPFKRTTIKEFRKNAKYERLKNPIEAAPERDIPLQLSEIVKKCLAFHPDDRFSDVSELIAAVENYIEGKPDWVFQSELAIDDHTIWEFQENVLLNRHLTFMRNPDVMKWVMLMITKESYTGNFKMEAEIKLSYSSQGLGFLFCIPEVDERRELEEGFCLWLGTKKNPGTRLHRSNVEVLNINDITLKSGVAYKLIIEKIDNRIALYLNGKLALKFMGYIPLVGSHMGLLCKDMDFKIRNWKVYIGSQSAMINCLSVPDAFLASKDFTKAFEEYSRIAQSFRGRVEGREALFRSGVTLLEQAKVAKEWQPLVEQANSQFEKLDQTSGAPLEYLGKSMIYKFEEDVEEEIKCLEIALRKYPRHPLIHMIREQVIFRMHESAKTDRKKTYLFALLALSQFPEELTAQDTLSLFHSIEKNLEPHSLFRPPQRYVNEKEHLLSLAMLQAFWLGKPQIIAELLTPLLEIKHHLDLHISNALFALLRLNATPQLNQVFEMLEKSAHYDDAKIHYTIHLAKLCANSESDQLVDQLKNFLSSPIGLEDIHAITYCFSQKLTHDVTPIKELLLALNIPSKLNEFRDTLLIKIALLERDFPTAHKILEHYPSEITHPLSSFYSLYATYLMATGGKKRLMESYTHLIELPHPPITALLAHFQAGHINLKSGWIDKSFPIEKSSLYEQLYILYTAMGKRGKLDSLKPLIPN